MSHLIRPRFHGPHDGWIESQLFKYTDITSDQWDIEVMLRKNENSGC
jgi:hypothetical protein